MVDYVHLLPLARGVVTVDQLGLFRWGSLRAFRRRPWPAWLGGIEEGQFEAYERVLRELAVDATARACRGFDRIGR